MILGPTASGKTGLSLELSKLLKIQVVSADSRQIYKYLNIGTAKPSKDELIELKHHFIDYLEPDNNYSAGKFAREATDVIKQVKSTGDVPFVVGGTGLYIRALCECFFNEEIEIDPRIREILENMLKEKGRKYLYHKLKEVDPESASEYNDMNPRRVIRALEYFLRTEEKFSTAKIEKIVESQFEPIYFGIAHPREVLYDRINQRAETMWKEGLAEELQKILDMGYSPLLNSINTVGYKEAYRFLKGEMNENETIEEIKKNTRRYAKRQLTWFRRNSEIIWLDGMAENNAEIMMRELQEKNVL